MPYNTKELDELLFAFAKIMNSAKASVDDDGKITFSDAFNFVDDVVPVWAGLKGAELILVDFDQITDEQKEASKRTFFEVLNFSSEDEAAFDKVLTWLFSTLEVLISFGAIPAAPTTEETGSTEESTPPSE